MCGISGIISFSEQPENNRVKIEQANLAQQKRGPDYQSVLEFGRLTLGHTRLSIIDTNERSNQPMLDHSGNYIIVFNGEIFNYQTLKKELELRGYRFSTTSDTEVLLYLLIDKGVEGLKDLDGEFAFAFYNKSKEELILCRDRFGIKPLHYYSDENGFYFSSEMKGLIAMGIPKKIDNDALQLYLHLNYIPSPYSILKDVQKVQPGTYLTIAKNKEVQNSTYYDIVHQSEPSNKVISYEDAQVKLRDQLTRSVQNRMIADVPLGSFLSGGIDSSIIASIAAKEVKNLHTFSIGFKDEPYFDETYFADLVAKKAGTEHTVFSLTNNDLFEHLYSFLDYIDEPFADSSALAVYILSKNTRKEVTVALSGDGADEMFGGYNKHEAALFSLGTGMKQGIIKSFYPILKNISGSRNSRIGNKLRQVAKLSEGMQHFPKERYWHWAGFANSLAPYALKEHSSEKFKHIKEKLLSNVDKDLKNWLITDQKMVLEGDMLVKGDRMSMANSLELRVPFLDHHLVDFCNSLPLEYKIKKGERKKILKDAFSSILPSEVISRSKKGFEVPLLKWFQNELKEEIEKVYFNDELINQQGVLNLQYVQHVKERLYSNSPGDAVAKAWAIIVFQAWYKKYFTQEFD